MLRLSFVEDMEFKDDEHYNFIQTQLIGRTEPWPWVGMPSGAYVPNPGLSIWVFVWLARLIHAQDPTQLAHGLQLFSWVGILLLIPFALRFIRSEAEEETKLWLWCFALAMVNPFAVYYQRKLWPEPFLPFFSMLFLMSWWNRDQPKSAFFWGLIGALLGQIHMSGFFYAGAFFLWTFINEKLEKSHRLTSWKLWFLGSTLGALPLIPWTFYLFKNGTGVPTGIHVSGKWEEISQLKFWVFWFSDALGFHLGNPLGLLRGNSHWAQISDFIRYPLISGHATYLNGMAHAVILGIGCMIVLRLILLIKSPEDRRALRLTPSSHLALSASLWGFGVLLTLSGVMIRRYYMVVSFPFEFVWIVNLLARQNPTAPNTPQHHQHPYSLLGLLWFSQVLISACFVNYIHTNQGAPQGDYGNAYHVVRDHYLKTIGKPWPERPLF